MYVWIFFQHVSQVNWQVFNVDLFRPFRVYELGGSPFFCLGDIVSLLAIDFVRLSHDSASTGLPLLGFVQVMDN